jgi:hypothetical protein
MWPLPTAATPIRFPRTNRSCSAQFPQTRFSLNYISDMFEEKDTELEARRAKDADPEDPDE